MNEDKLRLDAVRAARAKALLDDELLKETFEYLENEYVRIWKTSHPADDQGQQWYRIQALLGVKYHLQTLLSRGRTAIEDIDRIVAERQQG